jgi:hypothetical protein
MEDRKGKIRPMEDYLDTEPLFCAGSSSFPLDQCVHWYLFNFRDSLVMNTKKRDGYSTFLVLFVSLFIPRPHQYILKRRHPQFKISGPDTKLYVNQGSLAKRGEVGGWGCFSGR